MKFFHLADVHLGAMPDRGAPWSRTRGKEIWDTFRQVIRRAEKEQTDLVLIAGDLFHAPPSEEMVRDVNSLFASADGVRFALIAGNHDYLTENSPVLTFPWNRNVTWLFSREAECVRFPEIGTEVYGFSYYSQEITEPLYDDLHPLPGKNLKILLAHGGDIDHIPLNGRVIAKAGFDYVALGHIHKPGSIAQGVVYSGALTPIDRNDTGVHGYVAGELKKGRLKIEFVPVAPREYVHLEIPCGLTDTTFTIQERLEAFVRERGEEHIYHVVLTGNRNPGTLFDRARIAGGYNILEVEDQTTPAFHIEELRTRFRGQMIGDYIESFSLADMDETEELALQYGLEALLCSREDTD